MQVGCKLWGRRGGISYRAVGGAEFVGGKCKLLGFYFYYDKRRRVGVQVPLRCDWERKLMMSYCVGRERDFV